MQIAIDLSANTEYVLETQAAANGRSVSEYAAHVLSRFAAASHDPIALSEQFTIKTHEDALVWMLSRNPNLPSNHPEDTDWQQLKSEGRRF